MKEPLRVTVEAILEAIAAGAALVELKEYLRTGGDPNAPAKGNGWTLLHVSAEHMNIPSIEMLVAAGAELDLTDPYGQTPLHIAVDVDIDSVVQAERCNPLPEDFAFDTSLALLRLGANPRIRDRDGRTCRDWVAGYGNDILRRFDDLSSSLLRQP